MFFLTFSYHKPHSAGVFRVLLAGLLTYSLFLRLLVLKQWLLQKRDELTVARQSRNFTVFPINFA
jgi:hypothetical protein